MNWYKRERKVFISDEKALVTLMNKYLIINSSLRNGCFPDGLKATEVGPIFQKNYNLDKDNYKSVILFPHISMVFERIITFKLKISWKLSKLLTGFRKNHSTQQCLINMLEGWKNALDKGGLCHVNGLFKSLWHN